jgi:hypothetical protein
VSYRKKSELVEAHQWTGSNWHQMLEFAGRDNVSTNGVMLFLHVEPRSPRAITVHENWWVIRSSTNLFTTCAPDEFDRLYEQVPDPS